MINQEYVLKRGETGSVMDFTLRDEDGPVNLTGWTVTLTASREGEAPAISSGSCTLAASQTTTGKGKGTYEFTESSASIPTGTYRLEFKGVTPAGDVFYFPKSAKTPYATLEVIDSLG